MQWINKRNKHYRKRAHFIINRFVRDAWNADTQSYTNFNYDSFKRNKSFKALLFKEQNGYCCYCMRKMNLSESHLCTIEHILPHKIKKEEKNEIAYYYASVPFLSKYVHIIEPQFLKKKLTKGKPYPHFCAYENLVLSCSGAIYKTDTPECESFSKLHECCNNYRGQKRIVPIFFKKYIDIKYERDGLMTYDEKYLDTIEALNLEKKENLRLIRRIWANIAFRSTYTLPDIKKALTDIKLRSAILEGTDLDRNQAKRFMAELYWKLPIEYEWFGQYFNSLKNKNKYK